MHFLITGHTGFKGSWLSLMLHHQGHQVSGVSLNPEKDSLFNQAGLEKVFMHDLRVDIRNREQLQKAFKKISPDVVIHLAAQPLVLQSYLNPIETYETNVIGTLNVLESLIMAPNLRSALIITTDKVYKNIETFEPYDENFALGGDDPYSSSKAAADILTQSWTKSFSKLPIGIARAGNVIGGGDWGKDRLIPDLARVTQSKENLVVRNPKSIRPWQHVFDCLNGYLKLNEYLIRTSESGCWNFGPEVVQDKTVEKVIEVFSQSWGQKIHWEPAGTEKLHEAGILLLDSGKARKILGWNDLLTFEESVEWTANWYRKYFSGEDPATVSNEQIKQFFDLG